jgi:phosphoglycolate phosphatase-like HAD superfamily hydrolase
MNKTIIFDFDGTIVDSFNLALDIAYKLTKNPNLIDQEKVNELRTMSLFKAANEIGIPRRTWPGLLFKGKKMMTDRLLELEIFPGLDNLIAQLRLAGFKLYIVSSNSKKNISKIIQKNNLNQYFDNIYGGIGLLGKSKVLRFIMKQKHLSPSNVLYIGDEIRDIDASNKAHIKSIAVSWGYMSKSLLADHQPWMLVDNVEQLKKAIEIWNNA